MGQAKRRAAENKKWLDSLTIEERVVSDTAERLLHRFLEPMDGTGMCYRMTFFLHLYLAEKGIRTVPVIGYVNDGTDDIMISHAWLDYNGKKTDVTLANSERPDINPIGQVIVLDRIVRNGHEYSYHLEQSREGLAAEAEMLRDPRAAEVVFQKRAEHSAMLSRARDPLVMRSFLDASPDRMTFDAIKVTMNSVLFIKPA